MKRTLLFTVACTLVAPLASFSQTTIFSDDFSNGSTLNGASVPGGTPPASFTSYDIASSKVATTGPSIASGDLKIDLNSATTSGFVEAQALFTTTPVTLATVGDYINMTYTFTDTGGTLLAGGTSAAIFTGLFNSGGFAPLAGSLNNSGLSTNPASAFATGNAANWVGYAGSVKSGSTSTIYTRPLQNGAGTTSANQELLGNNFGAGAYANPGGAQLTGASTNGVATLTAGQQYTLRYNLALTAPGTLTATEVLYIGVGTNTSPYLGLSGTASGAALVTETFDGLAIGVRNSGTSFDPTMDISQINVSDLIQTVPEPSTLALAGLGVLGFAWRLRRPRC